MDGINENMHYPDSLGMGPHGAHQVLTSQGQIGDTQLDKKRRCQEAIHGATDTFMLDYIVTNKPLAEEEASHADHFLSAGPGHKPARTHDCPKLELLRPGFTVRSSNY